VIQGATQKGRFELSMPILANPAQLILGILLLASSLGVILAKKPIYSSLSFLSTLLVLAFLYLQLSAQFIAAMQILVYAGAILVIFIFVMVLFQDAHQQIDKYKAGSRIVWLSAAAILFVSALFYYGMGLTGISVSNEGLPEGYGTVQKLGEAIYIDFFFPFEAVILLFLAAVVGSLYIAKKEK
jgi:NADH-quinone oxidoreductase subunit J